MSKKALAVALTRTIEIAARQIVLAFAQSATNWLGIVFIACSAVVMSLLTFLDSDSLPSSAVVNFFALPFVNIRGWTTDIGWKPVGLPRCFFYSVRFVENIALCVLTVVCWRDAAVDIWNRWWILCIVGIVANVMLLPMVFLTTHLVSRDPKWVHPSARPTMDKAAASDIEARAKTDKEPVQRIAPQDPAV